jgi:hypothetical protein
MRTAIALLLLVVLSYAPPALAQGRYEQSNPTIRCSSANNGYAECRKPYRGPAELTQKYSEAGCANGSSWGQTDDYVWVDRGCRALFTMFYPPAGGGRPDYGNQRPPDYGNQRPPDHGNQRPPGHRPPDYGNQRPPDYGHDDDRRRQVECESRRDRYESCDWPREWRRPRLERQLSNSSCIEGRSWGYSRRDGQIWVDHGCRAIFSER